MLSNHIDTSASCEICEGDTESMGAYGIDDLLAVHAFIKPHFLLVGRSFAISASLV